MKRIIRMYGLEALAIIIGLAGIFCWIRVAIVSMPKTLIVNREFIRVRECASTACKWTVNVKRGDTFTILEEVTATPTYNWYKIEYQKGKYGYIASAKNEPYVLIHK